MSGKRDKLLKQQAGKLAQGDAKKFKGIYEKLKQELKAHQTGANTEKAPLSDEEKKRLKDEQKLINDREIKKVFEAVKARVHTKK